MTTVKAPTFAASVNRLMVALFTILVVGLSACAETAQKPPLPGSRGASNRARARNRDGWALRNATASPSPARPDPEFASCGAFDAGLARAAQRVAERTSRGLDDFTAEELAFTLRIEGEPHAWPEAWTYSAKPGQEADAGERA